MPGIQKDGKKKSFQQQIVRTICRFETQTGMSMVKKERKKFDEVVATYLDRVDLVQSMANQFHFMSQFCSNYAYWSHPSVLEASLIRYQKFMHLTKQSPKSLFMPTTDIALIRLVHQRQKLLPNLPCPQVNLDASYAETFVQWAELYNESYSSFPPSYSSWIEIKSKNPLNQQVLKKKWSKYSRLPSRNSRYVGVDEMCSMQDQVPWATAIVATDQNQVATIAQSIIAVIGTPLMEERITQIGFPILRKESLSVMNEYKSSSVLVNMVLHIFGAPTGW